MTGKTKTQTLKIIDKVSKIILSEIRDNASHGMYGAGLSSEGFAGGYLSAIHDISALMQHGYPSDHRGYFKRAARATTES